MADIKAQLAALEREKEGYVLSEKPDRVKQVDAEIARLRKAGDKDPDEATAERREKAAKASAKETTAAEPPDTDAG